MEGERETVLQDQGGGTGTQLLVGGVSDVVGEAIYRLGVALYVSTSVIPQKIF